jgi:multiple sugar transport system permease protein
MPRLAKRLLTGVIFSILLLLISLYVLVPIYWAFCISTRSSIVAFSGSSKYWSHPLSFTNYVFAWRNAQFSLFFGNTLIVSTLVAAFVILFGLSTAYALSRFRFWGRRAFIVSLLVSQLIPSTLLVVPFFLIFKQLGLLNSLWTLIIAYTTVFLPFNAILMKTFVDGIPIQLEEAAMIDGCSLGGVIARILVPLIMPGIFSVGAFAFINSWNEFLLPLLLINSAKSFVIAIGLNYMMGQNTAYYGALAAGSIIALSVPLLLFALMQKYLVAGLTLGGIKG